MKKTMFRKAVSVLTSAALLGSTIGMAAAVSYPAPFNAGNSAVVYGAQAAESDMIAATSIQSDINTALVSDGSTETTVEGGESFPLMKDTDALNLGQGISDVISSGKLDDGEFPTLLADGLFEGIGDTEYDYEQTINLANKSLELIYNTDLNDKEPTLGFHYDNEEVILTYNITMDSSDRLNFTDLVGQDMTLLGKDYYVLSTDDTNNDDITLLDTASSVVIQEGDSATVVVGGVSYDVSATIYDSGAVFTINGVTSDQLSDGGYDKLTELSTGDNDVYVVAKDVRYSSKDTGISEVEFSIGAGKIVLDDDASAVRLNGQNVDGLAANVSVEGIDLIWTADENLFLTVDDAEAEMPLFKAIKLIYGGINFPAEQEETELVSSENYITLNSEIKDGDLSLPILYRANTTYNLSGLGEELDYQFTSSSTTGTFNLTLEEDEHTSFVVTYINGDEGYSYAYKVSSVDETDGTPTLELESLVSGGEDFTGDDKLELMDDIDLDSINIQFVGNITTENATIQVTTTASSGTVSSNKLVTADGLQVTLPVLSDVYNGTDHNFTEYTMTFSEEDKDSNIASGNSFTAVISSGDTDGVHVSSVSLTERELQSDDDMYIAYVNGQLASKVEMDKSGDTNAFVVKYNDDEVAVDLTVATAEATVSSGEAGVALLMDSESVSGKNIVVVGGSAINAIAAELVGDVRGPAFTDATGVAAGEFLIESFDYNGAVALLVAGYDAADTTKAATYLANTDDDVVVEAGKKYTGSSATEATLVTA
jgi:hypothetical protein